MRSLFVLCFVLILFIACGTNDIQKEAKPRYNHVMLTVSDAGASAAFYEEAFGMELYKHLTEMVVLNEDAENDSLRINLFLMRMPGHRFIYEFAESPQAADSTLRSPHYQHVGIEVDDIDASIERAVAAGAEFAVPKRHLKVSDMEAKTVFFYGLDGEMIELMQMIEGDF